ncbi:MAG TPA: amidohydrolase family protein [Paracoccaceae bacterium]|nr:amidohydrolase family protein [Paracoccaceae bacterium]
MSHRHAAGSGCVICRAAAEAAGTGLRTGGDAPASPGRRRALGALAAAPLAGAGALGALGAPRARAQDAGGPPEGRFAIRAGWVLVETEAGEPALREDASVIVDGDRIEDVIDGSAGGLATVEAPGMLLLPGFISGHTHACSATPTRGIIEGGRSFAVPLLKVEALSDEEMDALTAFNVAELLLSGCTGHVEMSLSLRQAESYVRVAEAWGVRGWPGGMIPGISRLFPIWFRRDDQALLDAEAETLAEIEANLAFGRAHMGKGEGRIMPMISPHATDTHTPATMDAMAAAARELGTGIHIHLAQRGGEAEATERMWGMSPFEYCRAHGLTEGPFFGAHLSAFDFEADAEAFREAGAVYAHCPSAGGAGGGTQPWPEALAAGMATNIGIDTHSNDYVENLKLAVLYGQARHSLLGEEGRARPTVWTAVDAATRQAADGLGRPDLGRIKAGAKADLAAVDVSGFLVGTGARPPEPLNNLLYASGASVRHVLTDGRWQVWNGTLHVADPDAVRRAGGEAAERVWAMLREEDWFTETPR